LRANIGAAGPGRGLVGQASKADRLAAINLKMETVLFLIATKVPNRRTLLMCR